MSGDLIRPQADVTRVSAPKVAGAVSPPSLVREIKFVQSWLGSRWVLEAAFIAEARLQSFDGKLVNAAAIRLGGYEFRTEGGRRYVRLRRGQA